jgi:uncharacterized protein (DUF924 family)
MPVPDRVQPAMHEDIQDLLAFWFSQRMRPHWFASTPTLDSEIRARYEGLWQRGAAGELDDWMDTPEGTLALAIVLDQLPLNMYRGRPASFATEAQAIAVAKAAIAHGHDDEIGRMFGNEYLMFLFLPLMHSENPGDQERSVELFRAAGLDTRYPEHHRGIVRRFGRFPHRNAILGRASSQAELDYLASAEAFKG